MSVYENPHTRRPRSQRVKKNLSERYDHIAVETPPHTVSKRRRLISGMTSLPTNNSKRVPLTVLPDHVLRHVLSFLACGVPESRYRSSVFGARFDAQASARTRDYSEQWMAARSPQWKGEVVAEDSFLSQTEMEDLLKNEGDEYDEKKSVAIVNVPDSPSSVQSKEDVIPGTLGSSTETKTDSPELSPFFPFYNDHYSVRERRKDLPSGRYGAAWALSLVCKKFKILVRSMPEFYGRLDLREKDHIKDSNLVKISSQFRSEFRGKERTVVEELCVRSCENVRGMGLYKTCRLLTGSLRSLDVSRCVNLDARALENCFAHLKLLRRVELAHLPQVTDSTIEQIAKGCPQLQRLGIASCVNVEGASLPLLAEKCLHLHSLDVSYIYELNGECLALVSLKSESLRDLDASGVYVREFQRWMVDMALKERTLDRLNVSQIGDGELTLLAQAFPKLVEFSCVLCSRMTDGGIEEAFSVPGGFGAKLEYLNLNGARNCGDAAIDAIVSRCLRKDGVLKSLDLVRLLGATEQRLSRLREECSRHGVELTLL